MFMNCFEFDVLMFFDRNDVCSLIDGVWEIEGYGLYLNVEEIGV